MPEATGQQALACCETRTLGGAPTAGSGQRFAISERASVRIEVPDAVLEGMDAAGLLQVTKTLVREIKTLNAARACLVKQYVSALAAMRKQRQRERDRIEADPSPPVSAGAPFCHPCNAHARVLPGRLIGARLARDRWYWCCPGCARRVGCHAGTKTALGTLADAGTRTARVKAHEALDTLWRAGGPLPSRTAAYGWLASALGMASQQAHIGRFDQAACRRVIALCRARTRAAAAPARAGTARAEEGRCNAGGTKGDPIHG